MWDSLDKESRRQGIIGFWVRGGGKCQELSSGHLSTHPYRNAAENNIDMQYFSQGE